MKQGMAIADLASEIKRQAESKRDYIADMDALSMELSSRQVAGKEEPRLVPEIEVAGVNRFGIKRSAHSQMANRLSIPKKYYDRMLAEAPELLQQNVNHWIGASEGRRLIRTLDGDVRAILSERYRPLDNLDLAEAVLPHVLESGCEIKSCNLSDDRLYLKAVTPRLEAEVRVGDVVQLGINIGNSEVGMGSILVEPLVYRLDCLNGMISNASMRRSHVGRGCGNPEFEGASEFFRDETRMADDRAFWMKVTDTVKGFLTEEVLEREVNRLREATEDKIEGRINKVIEVTAKHLDLTEGEGDSILRHFAEGGDMTRYGLMNAVTRASQDVEDYERATQMERLGNRVLELPRTDWNAISQAGLN